MSPLVIDNFGSPIPLGPLIGSGGEGDVYEIDNRPGGYVAKLYKSPASSVKAEKLAKANADDVKPVDAQDEDLRVAQGGPDLRRAGDDSRGLRQVGKPREVH